MKVLVTGADGFVGGHLVRALRSEGHEVVEPPSVVQPGGLDIRRGDAVLALFEASRPDAVVHLAGLSSVAQSHTDPGLAFEVNATGTVHVLQAVRRTTPRSRVLVISSGEVYGALPPGVLAEETLPLRPASPYAAAKVAAEVAAQQFHRSYGMDVVCARPFNHLGRGQAAHFVVPSFARQLAAVKRGEAPPVIRTGDLSAVRDFSHVTDVVDAYLHLLRAGQAGAAYNVSSGHGRSIQSIVEEMARLAGVLARFEVDPERLRPAEIPALVGSSAALRATGWTPRRSVTEALGDVLAEQGVAGPGAQG
jgi:GDP-4-dehydro-6-deoxy-D-mannose reductase